MDQNDNAKIIKWLGWTRVKGFRHVWRLPDGSRRGLDPDFINLDADAITLLPVLMARDYSYCLKSYPDNLIFFQIYDMVENPLTKYNVQPTIAQAISVAVLQLIESI